MQENMPEDVLGSFLEFFSIWAESKLNWWHFIEISNLSRFQEYTGYYSYIPGSCPFPFFRCALCIQILFLPSQKHGLPTICQVRMSVYFHAVKFKIFMFQVARICRFWGPLWQLWPYKYKKFISRNQSVHQSWGLAHSSFLLSRTCWDASWLWEKHSWGRENSYFVPPWQFCQ